MGFGPPSVEKHPFGHRRHPYPSYPILILIMIIIIIISIIIPQKNYKREHLIWIVPSVDIDMN